MKPYFRSNGKSEREIGKAASRKITMVLLATLLCAIAVFGVGAYSKRSPEASAEVTARSAHVASEPLRPLTQALVEAEVITIRPAGFWPTRISRPPGQFLLAVENRSGLQTVDLVLEDQARRELFAARMPIVKPDLARRFDLVPGAYVLREASHPAWSCTITIENK